MSTVPHAFTLFTDRDGSVSATRKLPDPAPSTLVDLLAPWSRDKGRQMLAAIREQGGIFDWELALGSADQPVLARAVGANMTAGLIVSFGATVAEAAAEFEDATRRQPDRAEGLARLVKAFAVSQGATTADDEALRQLWGVNSEISATHRELVRANRELERTRNALNETLGMVAHDLRGPLHVLRMTMHLLTDSKLAIDDTSRLMSHADQSLSTMVALIDDLLDLHAVESGRLRIDLTLVDLADLVDRASRPIAWRARERGVTIRSLHRADRVEVLADPARLEQVLTNLLDNAARLTAPDSEIEVATREVHDGVEISVSDRGPGAPEDARQRLLEPHNQGENGGRAGLGLAIANRIMKEHGGQLRWETRDGGGSTFVCLIPRRPTGSNRSQATAS